VKPLTSPAGNPDRDVTERLAHYARTGNPLALWPGLTDAALAAARATIGSAVREVLAGKKATLEPAGSSVYALKVAAYTSGTSALLGRWIEDGRVRASSEVRDVFAQQLDQGRKRAARIEREVMPAIDALLARGITPIALKGFHVARAFHDEPGVRPAADVDLLVPPAQIPDAESALRDAGFEPSKARKTRPYNFHWIPVGISPHSFSVEGVDERNRWEIDLHDSFERRVGAWTVSLDPERVHVHPFVVSGRSLLAPSQPLLLLALACQLSSELKSMRLMRLVDLVLVIRSDRARGQLDWNQVMSHVSRVGCAKLAYPALTLAEQLAPGLVDSALLAQLHSASNRWIRASVARMSPSGGSSDKTSLTDALMWARGPVDAAKILANLAVRGEPFSLRAVVKSLRVLLRRIRAGMFSVGHADETAT
jgi:hypothetical protein